MIASCAVCGGPGVAVRDVTGGVGRIVQVANAGAFTPNGAGVNSGGVEWVNGTNLAKLYTNATKWAARCQ